MYNKKWLLGMAAFIMLGILACATHSGILFYTFVIVAGIILATPIVICLFMFIVSTVEFADRVFHNRGN